MRAILLVRGDAERVAPFPAGAELGGVVGAQNETVALHGGESEVTRLFLVHIVTTASQSTSSATLGDKNTILTRVHASGRVENRRKSWRKMRRPGKHR